MLEEFEKSTQKDTSIVQWQGFTEDGKLTVKDKDLSPVVKGVGQKYPKAGSDLILDSVGSVEQRKSSKKKGLNLAANRPVDTKAKAVPVIPFIPRSAIIALLEEFDEISGIFGDFFLAYGHKIASRIDAYGSSLNSGLYSPRSGNLIGRELEFDANNSDKYSSKDTYILIGYNLYLDAIEPYQITEVTSTLDLTGTPIDKSLTAYSGPGSYGWDYQHDAKTYFGQFTDNSITATVDYTLVSTISTGAGCDFEIEWMFYTPPETDFYLQAGSLGPDAEPPEHIKIDLQSYFTDTVIDYKLHHNYTKKTETGPETFSQQTFLIFFVETVDFSHEEVYTESSDTYYQYYPYEARFIGKLKRWYLHLKIDHNSGTIDFKTTLQLYTYKGVSYDSKEDELERYGGRTGMDVWAAVFSWHSSQAGARTSVQVDMYKYGDAMWSPYRLTDDHHPHYQDILSEAFEGDWLYDFRNVQIEYKGATNWPQNFESNFFEFLDMHFYEGTWYQRLNSGYINPRTYGTEPTPYFYYWEPLAYQNSYGIGLPPDTTMYAISNLVTNMQLHGTTVNLEDYFDGSVEGVPDVYDEWIDGVDGKQPPFLSLATHQGRIRFSYVQQIPLPT